MCVYMYIYIYIYMFNNHIMLYYITWMKAPARYEMHVRDKACKMHR